MAKDRQGFRYLENKTRQFERTQKKAKSMADELSKRNLEIKHLKKKVSDLESYTETLERKVREQNGRILVQKKIIEDLGESW